MAKKNEALLAAIAAGITAKGGTVTGSANLFAENLPEGITTETVDKVTNYTKDFVSCGFQALGQAAVDVLKADKKLDTVNGSIPMGSVGDISTVTVREHKSTPPAKEGEKAVEVITLGSTRLKVNYTPGTSNEGLSGAKTAIKAYAAEVLGKKK